MQNVDVKDNSKQGEETTTTEVASPIKQTLPDIIEMPELGNYLDYRLFLADFYRFKRFMTKRDLRPYSYAMFSAAANIKSPNYLKMIIEGKRNLGDDMIPKFAKAMGLDKQGTEEFRRLVNFTQSTDPGTRNMFLKELNEFRVENKLKAGEIDQKTWDKVPNWVTWILFAMKDQEGVEFQAEKIHELLRGKAKMSEIESAIAGLNENGGASISEDIPVALIRKLQTELIYLGLESLFRDSATEREFGTATLSLTKQEFEELRFQLRKFRKDVQKNIGMKRESSKGERVFQLNLQLFPVTDKA